jgi:cation transport ATPase
MTRKTTTLMLEHAECVGGSAFSIERVIREVPGVYRVYVNSATEAAYVEYDADRCSESDLARAVAELGIESRSAAAHAQHPQLTSSTAMRPMPGPSTYSRSWWAFAGFIAIAGFLLFTEHRAHLFGALPFLLLLACPFLHMFGHSGHGGHGGYGNHGGTGRDDAERAHAGHVDHESHHAHTTATSARGDNTW